MQMHEDTKRVLFVFLMYIVAVLAISCVAYIYR